MVIHRTDLFEKTGVDAAEIKTREQWIDATAKLNKGGTQGIYLPGQMWYALAGFIWDEGGDLAAESGGKWSGALDTPEALRGMEFYEQLQALGKGPKDSDEDDPPQAEVMAQGQVAQVISTGRGQRHRGEQPRTQGQARLLPDPGQDGGHPRGRSSPAAPTWSCRPPRPTPTRRSPSSRS